MKNKKILLAGYFGFNNVGDELILQSIIAGLNSQNDFSMDITVLSSDPGQTKRFYNVDAVNRWNPFSIISVMSGSDLVIFPGGLYQDVTSSLSLYYYLVLIVVARLLNRKTMLYGVDFGPIEHRINLLIFKQVLKLVSKITVRTKASYEFLEKTGFAVKGNKVNITADPVLSCLIVEPKQADIVNFKDKPLVKIGLILHHNDNKECHRKIMQFCESLNRRLNAVLVFVPFCLEGDLRYAQDIVKGINVPAIIKQWKKPTDICNILAELDFVISERLHGTIMSTILGIPVLGVSYNPKINNFMKELELKCIDSLWKIEPDILFGTVRDTWRWWDMFSRNINKHLPVLRYRACLNTKIAIELLK